MSVPSESGDGDGSEGLGEFCEGGESEDAFDETRGQVTSCSGSSQDYDIDGCKRRRVD